MSDFASRKVLVVEDQPQMRMLITMVLRKMGFETVLEAGDGSEAQSILEGSQNIGIDLVIADWNMPYVSGIELLKHIRSHKLYSDLPFLMVTCLDEEDSVSQAHEEGVTDYLVKPFSTDSLEKKVRQILI